MAWTIQPRQDGDAEAVVALVREAFSSGGRDGHEEVDIVRETWALGACPNGLELVAVEDGAVVGHVLGALGDLGGRDVVGVAPLSVAASYRGQGIGSALMAELLRRADEQGQPLVVVLGNPRYYKRFGFEPAGPLGIFYRPVGMGSPYFQARRLQAFDASLRGEFRYCWEGARS